MKKFKVYATWTAHGFHIVEAETAEKAIEIAYDRPLPDPKDEYGNSNYTITDADEIPVTESKSRKIP